MDVLVSVISSWPSMGSPQPTWPTLRLGPCLEDTRSLDRTWGKILWLDSNNPEQVVLGVGLSRQLMTWFEYGGLWWPKSCISTFLTVWLLSTSVFVIINNWNKQIYFHFLYSCSAILTERQTAAWLTTETWYFFFLKFCHWCLNSAGQISCLLFSISGLIAWDIPHHSAVV